jgi:hypothetical protein
MVRQNLDRLIKASPKDGYASISALLGKNHAYIYQFIKGGTPERLNEIDRHVLARYFGVRDWELGGPLEVRPGQPRGLAEGRPLTTEMIMVPFLDVTASAGSGSVIEEELTTGFLPVDCHWLRNDLGVAPTSELTAITVDGDSMQPTLHEDDLVLVDCGQREPLDKGIFVIQHEAVLHVKRLRKAKAGAGWIVVCDNPEHRGWSIDEAAESKLLGRVIWISRRL